MSTLRCRRSSVQTNIQLDDTKLVTVINHSKNCGSSMIMVYKGTPVILKRRLYYAYHAYLIYINKETAKNTAKHQIHETVDLTDRYWNCLKPFEIEHFKKVANMLNEATLSKED